MFKKKEVFKNIYQLQISFFSSFQIVCDLNSALSTRYAVECLSSTRNGTLLEYYFFYSNFSGLWGVQVDCKLQDNDFDVICNNF